MLYKQKYICNFDIDLFIYLSILRMASMCSFITDFREESEIHAKDIQKLLQVDDVEKQELNLETNK